MESTQLNAIEDAAATIDALRGTIHKAMVGQSAVIDQVLIALVASGHVLIEGVPGLGKTLLVRALAKALSLAHGRIQFTPDMLPSDITGHAILDPATRQLYVDLFRLMCVTPILFAASIAIGEVLVAHQRFLFYALAPILYTAGIVIATVLFGHRHGIYATAAGAVGGAVAHLAIRTIGLLRTPFRIRPRLAIRTPAFREFVRLMLPRMVSHPIDPLILTFFTNLAASIGVGAVTSFNFASDYQVVPVSLIGSAFSLAVFPSLAAAWNEGDGPVFRAILRRNVVTVALLTLVAAIALAILAHPIIQIVHGGGRFGAADVDRTAFVLALFALSIPFDSLSYPLSRALYASHNTLLQVAASIAGFATLVVAAALLSGPVGIAAIPLGYALGTALKAGLLAVFVRQRLRLF